MNNILYVGDCLNALPLLDSASIDLIITDPPFNIGKKYDSPFKDNKSQAKYFDWCCKWLFECERVLKPKGSLYIFNYPENNAYLMPILDNLDLTFKRWITWHYPTNTGLSRYNYTRTQTSILYYVKGKTWKDCTWNKDAVGGTYKNPADKRVKKLIAAGKKPSPYDVFLCNIVKNVSKSKLNHPCQLPSDIVETFIKASSNPGDVVLDIFAGSGTVLRAAQKLDRKFIGCELSPAYAKIIQSSVQLSTEPMVV